MTPCVHPQLIIVEAAESRCRVAQRFQQSFFANVNKVRCLTSTITMRKFTVTLTILRSPSIVLSLNPSVTKHEAEPTHAARPKIECAHLQWISNQNAIHSQASFNTTVWGLTEGDHASITTVGDSHSSNLSWAQLHHVPKNNCSMKKTGSHHITTQTPSVNDNARNP